MMQINIVHEYSKRKTKKKRKLNSLCCSATNRLFIVEIKQMKTNKLKTFWKKIKFYEEIEKRKEK